MAVVFLVLYLQWCLNSKRFSFALGLLAKVSVRLILLLWGLFYVFDEVGKAETDELPNTFLKFILVW